MASISKFPRRNCWRVSYTLHLKNKKVRKAKYVQIRSEARLLAGQLEQVERATRNRLADKNTIEQWVAEGWLKEDEAGGIFEGYQQEIIRTGEIAPVLGLTAKQERELFSRLVRSGIIIRLKRGVYLVPPRLPPGGRWSVSPYYILARLMAVLEGKYQISGPSAFHYYGFDDQVPNRTYVYNNRIFGARTIGGSEFIFMKTADRRLGATQSLKTPDGVKTVMASKPRALLDAVYDWSRYNTLPRAYEWIATTVEKESDVGDALINVTARFGNRGTQRRVGYLLEQRGLAADRLSRLKRKLGSATSLIPWVPSKPARGTTNREWGLIVNDTVPT